MKYRKLRIAWSVGWGLIAVLLIALWLQSCWYDGFVTILGYDFSIYSGEVLVSKTWDGKSTVIVVDGIKWSGSFVDPPPAQLPFWLPTSVALSLAALVWFPWRFSLRTLFIGTTLAAAAIGLVVMMTRRG